MVQVWSVCMSEWFGKWFSNVAFKIRRDYGQMLEKLPAGSVHAICIDMWHMWKTTLWGWYCRLLQTLLKVKFESACISSLTSRKKWQAQLQRASLLQYGQMQLPNLEGGKRREKGLCAHVWPDFWRSCPLCVGRTLFCAWEQFTGVVKFVGGSSGWARCPILCLIPSFQPKYLSSHGLGG